MNQLAEIFPVLFGENCAKVCRAKSENVKGIFCCFETAQNFLSKILRWEMKG
jgi:hypothetical protein